MVGGVDEVQAKLQKQIPDEVQLVMSFAFVTGLAERADV